MAGFSTLDILCSCQFPESLVPTVNEVGFKPFGSAKDSVTVHYGAVLGAERAMHFGFAFLLPEPFPFEQAVVKGHFGHDRASEVEATVCAVIHASTSGSV
jgi:hypothetical protein